MVFRSLCCLQMSDALIASKKCFVVATTSRARRGHMKKNPELEHEWFFLVPFWSGSARSFEEVGKRSKGVFGL